MYALRHRAFALTALFQEVEGFRLHSQGGEELAQVERVHAHDPLITDGQRGDIAVQHAQKRPGFYVVEAPVVHEELDRAARAGALLYLVEEDGGPPGGQGLPRESREVRHQRGRIQIALEDGFGERGLDEVDLEYRIVVRFGELADGEGFAHLTGPGYEQRLPTGGLVPFLELACHASL